MEQTSIPLESSVNKTESSKSKEEHKELVLPTRSYNRPENFINRELSWLEFNYRVLEEAMDPEVPLLEQLKFLSIFSSNLDEFFMVRVAGVRRQIDAEVLTTGPDGLQPQEVMKRMSQRIHEMTRLQHDYFFDHLAPLMAQEEIKILRPEELSDEQLISVHEYFKHSVLSVLTPLAIDPSHPFPHIGNKVICLIVELHPLRKGPLPQTSLAIIPITTPLLPRFVRLPSDKQAYHYILLEDVVKLCLEQLFNGYRLEGAFTVRVTRDSDLQYDEDPSEDLLKTITESLRNRRKGKAVRLQYDEKFPQHILQMLVRELELEDEDLYPTRGFIGFADLMQMYQEVPVQRLKDPPLPPLPVPEFEQQQDMFEVIRNGDVLVHHPYQNFDYVTQFLNQAAEDPQVIAIKMTLYRIAAKSPIGNALQLAAERGKQVAVLVELKARFDEEANIQWARKLEDAGAHVMYGMFGLKTHCKICLVVRHEKGKIRHYCHLGTGNYNDRTSRIYGDLGLFTCHPRFGEDLTNLFNVLTGYSTPPKFHRIKIAPTELRDAFISKIRREVQHVRDGRQGLIFAKMNALVDQQIILELYRASQAGVKIKLIIRGICCLKPGIKGLSENIEVISIVDRFLEHARIFYFQNQDQPEYYLASADWMPRNLDQRIEVLFPIKDPKHQQILWNILQAQWSDNVKARRMQSDGSYVRIRPEKKKIRSQMLLYQMTENEIKSLIKKNTLPTNGFQL